MTYADRMNAARKGAFNYDPSYKRSRVQVKTFAKTTSSTSDLWDSVGEVRHSRSANIIARNAKKAVMEDPYADLRDCMI